MDPLVANMDALKLAAAGQLERAAEALNELCAEYREFGPAYTSHALVFLMAGDTAQAMTDLDAAEWANREYGTPEQVRTVHETRALAHAVRTIYAAKDEAEACRQCVDEARKLSAPPGQLWFVPAAALEFTYKEPLARRWVEGLAKVKELAACANGYFKQTTGLLRLLIPPRDQDLVPAYFARHLRSRREGDAMNTKAHLKSVQNLVKGLEPYAILARFAAGEARVETA